MKQPENGYYVLEVADNGSIIAEWEDYNPCVLEDKRLGTLNRAMVNGSINNDGGLNKYPDMPRFDTYDQAKEVLDHWRKMKMIDVDEYDTIDILLTGEVRKKYYICKIEFME